MKRTIVPAALLLVAGLVPALSIGLHGALAHEPRIVAGKYEMNVGFVNEPVEPNERNGVDLGVTNIETGQPVEGLETTLKVDVLTGDQPTTLKLNARPDQKGRYTGELGPSQPGIYVFRFYGAIESASVDERFQLGPVQFDSARSNGLQTRTVAIAVIFAAPPLLVVVAYLLASRRAGQVVGGGRHEEPI